jgi:adenosylhomocysteine nucleosidase
MQDGIKLGIIGAMEVEVKTLMDKVEGAQMREQARMTFCEGKLNGMDVVIARCGIGKVSAALCVQAMVDLYGVTHIMNTGVAGSLDARIDIADLVVATDAVEHDMDVTPLGYERGQVPGMDCLAYQADRRLAEGIKQAAAKAAPDVRVYEGRVVSGDQFVASAQVKADLKAGFDGMCCEMEGASIAHACHVNGVPFAIVRAISDKADGSADMAYDEFEASSAVRCARVVEELCAAGF